MCRRCTYRSRDDMCMIKGIYVSDIDYSDCWFTHYIEEVTYSEDATAVAYREDKERNYVDISYFVENYDRYDEYEEEDEYETYPYEDYEEEEDYIEDEI